MIGYYSLSNFNYFNQIPIYSLGKIIKFDFLMHTNQGTQTTVIDTCLPAELKPAQLKQS